MLVNSNAIEEKKDANQQNIQLQPPTSTIAVSRVTSASDIENEASPSPNSASPRMPHDNSNENHSHNDLTQIQIQKQLGKPANIEVVNVINKYDKKPCKKFWYNLCGWVAWIVFWTLAIPICLIIGPFFFAGMKIRYISNNMVWELLIDQILKDDDYTHSLKQFPYPSWFKHAGATYTNTDTGLLTFFKVLYVIFPQSLLFGPYVVWFLLRTNYLEIKDHVIHSRSQLHVMTGFYSWIRHTPFGNTMRRTLASFFFVFDVVTDIEIMVKLAIADQRYWFSLLAFSIFASLLVPWSRSITYVKEYIVKSSVDRRWNRLRRFLAIIYLIPWFGVLMLAFVDMWLILLILIDWIRLLITGKARRETDEEISYRRLRTLTEMLTESIPQLCIQGWILWISNDFEEGDYNITSFDLIRSIVASSVNLLFQLVSLYFESKNIMAFDIEYQSVKDDEDGAATGGADNENEDESLDRTFTKYRKQREKALEISSPATALTALRIQTATQGSGNARSIGFDHYMFIAMEGRFGFQTKLLSIQSGAVQVDLSAVEFKTDPFLISNFMQATSYTNASMRHLQKIIISPRTVTGLSDEVVKQFARHCQYQDIKILISVSFEKWFEFEQNHSYALFVCDDLDSGHTAITYSITLPDLQGFEYCDRIIRTNVPQWKRTRAQLIKAQADAYWKQQNSKNNKNSDKNGNNKDEKDPNDPNDESVTIETENEDIKEEKDQTDAKQANNQDITVQSGQNTQKTDKNDKKVEFAGATLVKTANTNNNNNNNNRDIPGLPRTVTATDVANMPGISTVAMARQHSIMNIMPGMFNFDEVTLNNPQSIQNAGHNTRQRDSSAHEYKTCMDQANIDTDTPLYLSIFQVKFEFTELLLKNGANPNILNSQQKTPLFFACVKRRPDIVRLLLDYNVNVFQTDVEFGNTAFMETGFHSEEVAKVMLNHVVTKAQERGKGVKLCDVPDMKQQTVLFKAVNFGMENIVKEIIHSGANMNFQDKLGQTCLWKVRKQDILKLLVNNGANVNIKDRNGDTPIFGTCKTKAVYLLFVFEELGADMKHVNKRGETILHALCNVYEMEFAADFAVRYELIELVNRRRNNGETIMDMMGQWVEQSKRAKRGLEKVLKLLSDNGVDTEFDLKKQLSSASSDGGNGGNGGGGERKNSIFMKKKKSKSSGISGNMGYAKPMTKEVMVKEMAKRGEFLE